MSRIQSKTKSERHSGEGIMVRYISTEKAPSFTRNVCNDRAISQYITSTEDFFYDCEDKCETSVCFNTDNADNIPLMFSAIKKHVQTYKQYCKNISMKEKKEVNEEKLFIARCLAGITVYTREEKTTSQVESILLSLLAQNSRDVRFEKFDFTSFNKNRSNNIFWVNFKSIKKASAALDILSKVDVVAENEDFLCPDHMTTANSRLILAEDILRAIENRDIKPIFEEIMEYFDEHLHVVYDERKQVVLNILKEYDLKWYLDNGDDFEAKTENVESAAAGAPLEQIKAPAPEKNSWATVGPKNYKSALKTSIEVEETHKPSASNDTAIEHNKELENALSEIETLKNTKEKLSKRVTALESMFHAATEQNNLFRQAGMGVQTTMHSPLLQATVRKNVPININAVGYSPYYTGGLYPGQTSAGPYALVGGYNQGAPEYFGYGNSSLVIETGSDYGNITQNDDTIHTGINSSSVLDFSNFEPEEIYDMFYTQGIKIENVQNLRGAVLHSFLEKGDVKVMKYLLKSLGLTDFDIKFAFPSVLSTNFLSLYSEMEKKLLECAE